MKDQLIDTINKNRRVMTVSTFSLIGVNMLLTILIMHFKHPQMINMTDSILFKSFFWNFG